MVAKKVFRFCLYPRCDKFGLWQFFCLYDIAIHLSKTKIIMFEISLFFVTIIVAQINRDGFGMK